MEKTNEKKAFKGKIMFINDKKEQPLGCSFLSFISIY